MRSYVSETLSLATLAGVVTGFLLVLGAIAHSTQNYHSFLSLEGFLIVVGGTIANAFMSYQARYVLEGFRAVWHMLKKPVATREGLNADILRLIQWAYLQQSKGFKGLEAEITTIQEPLLRYGIELVITGYRPEQVRNMMDTATDAQYERRIAPVAVLRNMASTAPAFGMVGTLVGMVIMLQNIEGDMNNIGSGLAVALLATLYGIVLARLICLPAADKLLQKEEIMRFRNSMITEGMGLLAEKLPPRGMQDRLNSFLEPNIHFNLDDYLRHRPQERKSA